MKALINLFVVGALLFAQSAAAETIKSDVVYGHKDGMALVYDVIKPDNSNGAVVVFMVSGGWYSRWAPAETRARQFDYLLDAGFTLIPVHHGSAPRYHVPDAYADVSRAIRHIKLNAGDYGIDKNRIGVFGGSAGGSHIHRLRHPVHPRRLNRAGDGGRIGRGLERAQRRPDAR